MDHSTKVVINKVCCCIELLGIKRINLFQNAVFSSALVPENTNIDEFPQENVALMYSLLLVATTKKKKKRAKVTDSCSGNQEVCNGQPQRVLF